LLADFHLSLSALARGTAASDKVAATSVPRALLGIGMGGEWPAGAALAMETWPVRSRGFMGGVLQGSWGLGFMLSSAIYGLFYAYIGWRGMLWIGVLPALSPFVGNTENPRLVFLAGSSNPRKPAVRSRRPRLLSRVTGNLSGRVI
jgi:MFS family permease